MQTVDKGYTTPEGHWLARPVAFPDTRDFADILISHGEWPRWEAGKRPEVEPYATIRAKSWWHDNRREYEAPIGPYCSVSDGRPLKVEPTQATLDYLRERCVTLGDPNARVSFEVILHKERNRALVTAHEELIISSIWLGYVDPATVPGLQDVSAEVDC